MGVRIGIRLLACVWGESLCLLGVWMVAVGLTRRRWICWAELGVVLFGWIGV